MLNQVCKLCSVYPAYNHGMCYDCQELVNLIYNCRSRLRMCFYTYYVTGSPVVWFEMQCLITCINEYQRLLHNRRLTKEVIA